MVDDRQQGGIAVSAHMPDGSWVADCPGPGPTGYQYLAWAVPGWSDQVTSPR